MAKKLVGFQIVDQDDNPPKGQPTYNIYPLTWCLKFMYNNDEVHGVKMFWRLIPIYEGDVKEPCFPHGKSSLKIEV